MSNAVFYRGMLSDQEQLALLSANTWPIVLAVSATYNLRAIAYTALSTPTLPSAMAAAIGDSMPHIVTMATDMGVPVLQVGYAQRHTKKGGNRGLMLYAARVHLHDDQSVPVREADLESVNIKYMLKNVCDTKEQFYDYVTRATQEANTGTAFATPVSDLMRYEDLHP